MCFFVRPFWIRDVTHLNTVGLGNPIKRTCATCHNSRMVGMDLAPGWMDLRHDEHAVGKHGEQYASVRNPWSHAYRPELPSIPTVRHRPTQQIMRKSFLCSN